MNELRYAYFGRGKSKDSVTHDGIVCVGYDLAKNRKSVSFSVAFCSPGDHFSRKKAHAIIQGRFNKGQFEKVSTGNVTTDTRSYELAVNAITTCIADSVNDVSDDRYIGVVSNVHIPRWFDKKQLMDYYVY